MEVPRNSARGVLTERVRTMLREGGYVRYHIFICFRQGKKPRDALWDIELVVPNMISLRTVRRWYNRFLRQTNDTVSFEDAPRKGRPRKLPDNTELGDTVLADGECSTRELGRQFRVSHSTVARELSQLRFTYRLPPNVPYKLNEAQKFKRVECCHELLAKWNCDPAMHRLVTCDETMIQLTRAPRRRRWLRTCTTLEDVQICRNSRRRSGVRRGPPAGSRLSFMMTMFFNRDALIHYELFDCGQTLNAARYQEQLTIVAGKLGLVPGGDTYYLLHDNCSSHRARSTLEKARELGFTVLDHPPYSPDISPSDFYVFRSFKHEMSHQVFTNKPEVRAAVEEYIRAKDELGDFWAKAIDALPTRWRAVISVGGDYPDYDANEHLLLAECEANED